MRRPSKPLHSLTNDRRPSYIIDRISPYPPVHISTPVRSAHSLFSASAITMNRLALHVRRARVPPIPTSAFRTGVALPIAARRHYASSAPKEAEQASAQSGGSRSKDAKEQVDEVDTGNNPSTDRLAGDGAKGRTGGGDPLSSSENPPPQPKINNASIPGQGRDKLTKEQQEEVDRHNAEFEKKVNYSLASSPFFFFKS